MNLFEELPNNINNTLEVISEITGDGINEVIENMENFLERHLDDENFNYLSGNVEQDNGIYETVFWIVQDMFKTSIKEYFYYHEDEIINGLMESGLGENKAFNVNKDILKIALSNQKRKIIDDILENNYEAYFNYSDSVILFFNKEFPNYETFKEMTYYYLLHKSDIFLSEINKLIKENSTNQDCLLDEINKELKKETKEKINYKP